MEYNDFLKTYQSYYEKAQKIVKYFSINNMCYDEVSNIIFEPDKIKIVTIIEWPGDDTEILELSTDLFFGSIEQIKKYIQFLIKQKNLGRSKYNQIKFYDIK